MYVPNNAAVYDAATASVAGFYSGQLVTVNVAWYVSLADAWGQAIDTAWGAGAYTATDLQNIRVCSVARLMSQGAGPNATQTTPQAASYAADAIEIVALVRGMTAEIVAQGIDPNAGSGGGPTPYYGFQPGGAGITPVITSIDPNAADTVETIAGVPLVAGQKVFVDISHQYVATFTGELLGDHVTVGTVLSLSGGNTDWDEIDESIVPSGNSSPSVAYRAGTRTTVIAIGSGPADLPPGTYDFSGQAYLLSTSGTVAVKCPRGSGVMRVTVYGP